jgi:8-oxo-dGTP diphosphatase
LIEVAIGVITNQQGQVLIAQRPAHTTYGAGLWEFPGGKIEPQESVFAALQRELLEEIGIHILSAEPWFQLKHDYPNRTVFLHNWFINEFSGEPYGAEGQLTRWVHTNELFQYEFPAGNKLIIDKLTVGDLRFLSDSL